MQLQCFLLCWILSAGLITVSGLCTTNLSAGSPTNFGSENVTSQCQNFEWIIQCKDTENVTIVIDQFQLNCTDGWLSVAQFGIPPQQRAARSLDVDPNTGQKLCDGITNKTYHIGGSALKVTFKLWSPSNETFFNATWGCFQPATTPKPTTTQPSTPSTTVKPTTTQPPTTPGVYCLEEVDGDFEWLSVTRGGTARTSCIGGTGFAYRECEALPGGDAAWSSFVNMENCTSFWLEDIEKKISDSNVEVATATDALKRASSTGIQAGDVTGSGKILGDLNNKARIQLRQESNATEITQDYTTAASNYFAAPAWDGIPKGKWSGLATKIIERLEEFLQVVAETKTDIGFPELVLSNTASDRVVTASQAFSAGEIQNDVQLVTGKVMDDAVAVNADWRGLGNVEIPKEVIQQASGLKKYVTTSVVVARNLSRFLDWNETLANDVLEDKKANGTNATAFVNTYLVTVSLDPKPRSSFTKPVTLSMSHLEEVAPEGTIAKCVFWNETESDWSDFGVVTEAVHPMETMCQTSHFTSFAVIMMTRHVPISESHTIALSAISLIGISVSLVSLVLAFSVFVNCRSLQSTRNTIHKNLVASLALSYVFFIVGITRTENKIACSIFAAILYYFLMVSILWMLMEGIQLYVMLVQVFPKEGLKKHYYIVCWGLPGVFAIVGWSIFREGFQNERYCWLSMENHFIWAFVGPALLVFVINTFFLVMTFRIIFRNAPVLADPESATAAATIKYWAKGSLGLLPLLGVTWLFGVLFLNSESIMMAYLFNICNAFQGLYIFVFYCVLNEKVKEEFHRRIWSSFTSSSGGTTLVKDTKTGGRSPTRKQASTFYSKKKDVYGELKKEGEEVDGVSINMGKDNLSTFSS